MLFHFSVFTLDTSKQELFVGQRVIPLTRQNYDVLLYFLNKPGQLISKKELIEQVWEGRIVEENTIDKSITKLRKIFLAETEQVCFETAYGKGIKFIPEIRTDIIKYKNRNTVRWIGALLMLLGLAFFLNNSLVSNTEAQVKNNIFLMVTEPENAEWLNQGTHTLISQLLGQSQQNLIKDFRSKPNHMSMVEHMENQWNIAPELIIIKNEIRQLETGYELKLLITGNNNPEKIKTFSGVQYQKVITAAYQWLQNEFNDVQIGDSNPLMHSSAEQIEWYLRGITAAQQGDHDRALKFFELCLIDNQHFFLARLELAKSLDELGKKAEALAQIDTLVAIDPPTIIQIKALSIKGSILEKQGQHDKARDLHLSLLNKHQSMGDNALYDVRLSLSYSYMSLTENDLALNELNYIIEHLSPKENPELLAEVYRKRGSLLQKTGQTQSAIADIKQARKLFSQLGDLIGEAKVLTSLARIAQHQAKYDEAIGYLNHGLAIVRSLNNKVGIGATLNELIYVLMSQGHFDQAWDLSEEMDGIAKEIDYAFMMLAAKQFFIDISRARKQWHQAGIYLDQHLKIATETNNSRALINNRLLKIDLLLDQKQVDNLNQDFDFLQQHITAKKELRLQPRLDRKKAQFELINGNDQVAIELLTHAKQMATKTDDIESIIEINSLLAEHYFTIKEPSLVLQLVNENLSHQSKPYPSLLLKSKAHSLLGEPIKALEAATECKQKANDFWQVEDQSYLNELVIANSKNN